MKTIGPVFALMAIEYNWNICGCEEMLREISLQCEKIQGYLRKMEKLRKIINGTKIRRHRGTQTEKSMG